MRPVLLRVSLLSVTYRNGPSQDGGYLLMQTAGLSVAYNRYIITWKLCTGMAASDVQDTLNQALEETGLDQANVVHRPRVLSDNGPCYISGDLAEYLEDKGMPHTRGAPYHPQTQGKIRLIVSSKRLPGSGTLASDPQEPHLAGELLPTRRSRSTCRRLRRPLQPSALP